MGLVLGGQHVSGAEPARRHHHLVRPAGLLLGRRCEGLRGEQAYAVHLADQRGVHARQAARGADAVGGREFRGLHLGGVEVDLGRVGDRNALLLNEFGSRQAATSSRSSSGIDSGGTVVRSTSGCRYTIRLTRSRSLAGSPMKKSSPSGAAISSAKKRPGVRPDTRRITSPTSQPKVRP